jgi:AcrR family transcriptional regulator
LPVAVKNTLKPRKTPVQARSAFTVDALLEATIQVLLAVGKERLTTTAVAHRAGVSVGTLYQYFPNKRSLLQAALKQHIETVSQAIERACEQHQSKRLLEMGTALITAYLDAKLRDTKASAALYAVSSDIDGAAISRAASARAQRVAADFFRSAKDRLTKDPEVIATVVFAALNGIARRVLEAKFPEREVEPLRKELIVLVHAYLRTCTAVPPGKWQRHRGPGTKRRVRSLHRRPCIRTTVAGRELPDDGAPDPCRS